MIDVNTAWEIAASTAAMILNLSYISQIKLTLKNQSSEGLAMSQWLGFATGSLVFVGFYINLEQWAMAGVSTFGLFCCLFMMYLIQLYKPMMEKT